MQQLDALVRQYFPLLLAVGVVSVAAKFAWRGYRHWQYGISFPPLKSVQVQFHERMASGSSDKTFFSRFGGARNCLRVTVTDDEVWVRMFFPFSLIKEADLEYRIARECITSASSQSPSSDGMCYLTLPCPTVIRAD